MFSKRKGGPQHGPGPAVLLLILCPTLPPHPRTLPAQLLNRHVILGKSLNLSVWGTAPVEWGKKSALTLGDVRVSELIERHLGHSGHRESPQYTCEYWHSPFHLPSISPTHASGPNVPSSEKPSQIFPTAMRVLVT